MCLKIGFRFCRAIKKNNHRGLAGPLLWGAAAGCQPVQVRRALDVFIMTRRTAAAPKRQRGSGENKDVKVAPRCVQKGQRVFGCIFPLPRPGGIQARPTAADAAGGERVSAPSAHAYGRGLYVGREAQNLPDGCPAGTNVPRSRWAGKYPGGGPAKGQTSPRTGGANRRGGDSMRPQVRRWAHVPSRRWFDSGGPHQIKPKKGRK